MPPEPAALAERFLQVIEEDIVPKTRAGVAAGNKLFGAAILKNPICRSSSQRPTRKPRTRSSTARFLR